MSGFSRINIPSRRRRGRNPASSARGFCLVEAVITVVITGVMLVAALNTVGASQTAQFKNARRNVAFLLAQDMMTEICQQKYSDSDEDGSIGPDTGEADGVNRNQFDDVDDYNNWSQSPPRYRGGEAISWAAGYQRTVTVCWLKADDLEQVSAGETGIKRIEVRISAAGKMLVTLRAIRTSARQDPLCSGEG